MEIKELRVKCIENNILDNNDNLLVDFRQYKDYDTFLEKTGLTLIEGVKILDYCLDKARSKSKYDDWTTEELLAECRKRGLI